MRKLKNALLMIFAFVALSATSVFFTACEDEKPVSSISCDKSEVEIEKGDDVLLTFTVKNYILDGEIALAVFDNTSTGEFVTSEIIDCEVIYRGGGVSDVIVTGLQGGNSTIVAKTNSGGISQFEVKVLVKEYSSSLENAGVNSYVAKDYSFTPSTKNFKFSQNATEKNLTFYIVQEGAAGLKGDVEYQSVENGVYEFNQSGEVLKSRRFDKVEIIEDDDGLKVKFTDNSLETQITFEEDLLSEKETFYYIASVQGEAGELFEMSSFMAMKGIAESDLKIQTAFTNGETDINEIHLVSGDEERNSATFHVRVPKNLEFESKVSKVDNKEIISVQKSLVKSGDENFNDDFNTYKFVMKTTNGEKSKTLIVFDLYYEGFTDQEGVWVSKEIPVEILVKPKSIKVNDLEETHPFNNYTFYQNNSSSFKGQELFVRAFPEDSSYSSFTIEYNQSDLIVKQNNRVIESGGKITDFSKPLFVTGKKDATIASEKFIKITLNSDVYEEDKITYDIKYKIEQGASRLTFTNPDFEYDVDKDNTGIFVDSSLESVEFAELKADNEFLSAKVIQDDNSVADVSVEKDGLALKFDIKPKKVGVQSVFVMLDNGVGKKIDIRVIDTFNSLFIEKNENELNSGFQELKRESDGSLTAILRNGYEEGSYVFGKTLSFNLFSENGSGVITSVAVEFSESGIIEASGKTNLNFVTTGTGQTRANVYVRGVIVENFTISSKTEEKIINFVSYNPVQEFDVLNEEGEPVRNVELFADPSAQSDERTVQFFPKVNEGAFNFYNYENNIYESQSFDKKFVTFTTDLKIQTGETIFTQMTQSGEYWIYRGGTRLGKFNAETLTFTANDENETALINLTAIISQYGIQKSYPITITLKSYTDVDGITSSKEVDQLNFTAQNTFHEFQINLVNENATNKNLALFVNDSRLTIDKDGKITDNDATFIDFENSKLTKVKDGVFILKLVLRSTIESEQNKDFELKIAPEAWLNGNSIKPGKNPLFFDLTYSDGTEENPYLIFTAEDFVNIKNSLNSYYKVSGYIDVSHYASQFPLGAFSGSLIGVNSAKIAGINLTKNDGTYLGLFTTNSGTIENVSFEGSVNVESSSLTHIGLVAGENSGTLKNIDVVLKKSNISLLTASATFVGGVVGLNSGVISSEIVDEKPNTNGAVVFMDEKMNVSVKEVSNIGGVAGSNTGSIYDTNNTTELKGYSAYFAYTQIEGTTTIKGIEINLGGIAGLNSGIVYGMIVGGEVRGDIDNSNVGGIVGKSTGGHIGKNQSTSSLTTVRTLVRGVNAGAVTGTCTESTEFGEFSVEAVDDGERIGFESAMIVKFGDSDELEAVDEEGLSEGQTSYILSGTRNIVPSGVSFKSFLTRTLKDSELAISPNEYYGDYVIYNNDGDETFDGKIKAQYLFTLEQSVIAGLEINTSGGCVKMTAEEGNHPKMFMMFHFGARGYLDNGNFTTVSLGSVQNLLDMNLNTHKPDSVFLPFKTDKNTEIISKNTNILQILNDGTWFVKGTGVCEIVLTNILNETLNETILIYIVPYFNNVYFANPEDDGTPAIMPSIFVNEGVRYATGKSTLKIISRESAVIDINPLYKYESNDLIIKNDGSVMVDNKTIYLKPSQSFTAQVEEEEGENNFDYHAQALISSDSIRISKLSNAQTNAETVDKIKLKASIDYTYNGVDYTFELPEKAYPNLEVNYYEGVSQVKSTTEYYSLSTATVQQDKITIVSDDSDEKLHYEIYKNNNLIQKNSWSSSVESVASYDFEGNQLEDADKFLNITIINNTELVSDVKISVNKSSSLYKNRFENDIYGEYEVVFFGSSNQAICKRITLNLDDTQIESVVFANYPNKDELSMQTEKVIPGNEGVVTIAFSPADAEFYSIKVSNDSRNFAEGASYAGFIFGKVVNGEFEAFKSGMSFSSDGSVSITKKDLMANISNYQGEFAVRYRFFNTAKVTDGASVALNFVIVDFNQNILKEESVELTIDKEFFFDVTVDGKSYDDEVGYTLARGVTYDLTVENWGYDEDSVEISTSDSLLGVVEKTETGHKLHLTAFESEDQSFTIDMKATRTDAEGKEQTIEKSRKICIMDFVINYNKTAQNLNPDIVKGMDNGVIEVALNSEFELEIDFDNFSMLEYDAANRAVVNRVEEFLKTIQTGGVWTLYTSNSKNPPPVSVSDDFTKLNITEFTDTQTDEFTAYKHNIIFKKEHSPDQRRYVFTYNVKIGIEDGKYKIDDSEEIFNFDIEFLIDAYLLGSEEYPNPISSYDVGENSFVNMKAGGNYILTNDIYVTPENFKPINFNSNMLDGNSFTIFFKSGEYVLDTTQAALFLDVQEFSTIKNLKIVFEDASNGVVFKTSNILEPLTFASVAISNSGNLTNIEILGDIQVDLANKSNSDLDLPDGSIVAGLCATNSGNITHSRVFASIKANSSLSGMVGANSGVVSSSYYKEGTLVNKSSQAAAFEVAGLVISNSESGIISSSYTSGEVSSSHIYSYYTNKSKINSTMETAGFIYQNDGEIYDCYSNIPLDVPGKGSSGFVYKNYGLIQNSFTTSISLQKENTSSYSFAFSNTSSEGGGTFENCYSLEDPDYSYSAGDTVSGINTSLKKNNFEGVSVLNVAGFANLNNFSTYAHGKTSQNYNNVWMFVQKDQFVSEDIFRRTLIQKTNNKYSGQEFESQTFISGRLELVSSNIIATSFKELQDDFELDENGNTQYIYNQFIYEGSQNNPYLINTAQKFDEYMGQSSRVYSHFRIINDLDYNELSSNISTHKTEFKGMLEGNRMTLSNAIIFGSESLTSAGLIGSIMGTDLNSKVAVQNLTIIPKRVSFANASIVGTLAGQTKWANIANIQILSNANDDEEGQSSMVVVGGKNIVGGVIGLADANTKIKNIESSISARAYFLQSKLTETQEGIFDGNVKNIEEKSYAGTVVGYAYSTRTSNTTIENIKVLGSNISVTGGKIGFVFGGISQKVIVNHVEISILDGMELHSTVYAGLILGESAGVLSNITINGSATLLETFSTEKYIPTAVGGVCGWMIEGKLEKVYMGQSFDIVQRKNNYTDALLNVSIIGGIAGIAGGQTSSLRKCELNQIVMDGSISAHGIMGGVVGHNQADLELNKVALYKHNLDLSGFQEKSIIGGFVGSSTEKVKITNAYSHLDIQLSAFVYGTRIEASINAIIGEQKAGAVTDLENIYTTTIYDVVLENKSCMGSVKEVKAIPDGANAENCLFGFSDTVFGPEEKDGIKINFNATTTSTNKVYNFFGLIETKDSENENADVLKSGANLYNKVLKTTRFSARTDFGKEIVLNQKEFGRSILSHYNSINNNDEILPTIEMFYGLMSEAGGHWVNKDSNDNKILSYLTFEENVVPVK